MKTFKHIGTGDYNLEHISDLKAWQLIEETPTNLEFILTTKEPLIYRHYAKICAILSCNHLERINERQKKLEESAKKPRPI